MKKNFRDAYNRIIDLTETYIKLKASEIKRYVARDVGINERLMQTAFEIVSGMNYHEYVERRKLCCFMEYVRNNTGVTQEEALKTFSVSKIMMREYISRYLGCNSIFEAVYFTSDWSMLGKRYSYQINEGYDRNQFRYKVDKAIEVYDKDFDPMVIYYYLKEQKKYLRGIDDIIKPGDEIKCFKLDWLLEDFRNREICRSRFNATDDDLDYASAISLLMAEDIISVFERRGEKNNAGWDFDEDYHEWEDEEKMNSLPDEDYYVDGDWDYEAWERDISMDMGYMEDEDEDLYY